MAKAGKKAPATQSQAADAQRLPVSLLTGFLGSGKTTVLNHLLRQPELAQTVVVINEFGEIGLDHELVESASEEMVLLQSGCLCCTIRGDLIDTLRTLFLRRVRGEIAAFERMVIETTGLADPTPILHTLMTDPLIAARYRLDGVITTIDAATGQATLDRQIESVKQAAVADRLILTKTDLVEGDPIEALERRLRALNPAAPILRAVNGAVAPARLFDAGLYDPKTKSLDVQRWLSAEAYEDPPGLRDPGEHHGHTSREHDDDHDDHGDHGHEHVINRHDDHIKAVCLTLDAPVPAEGFRQWFEILMMLKGPDLLRVKAILNIEGNDKPIVLHGVQHIFHPTATLPKWPSADRRSRIVFIGWDLDEAALRDTLKLFAIDDGLPRPCQ
jgi:G3E family GTPase